MGNTLFREKIRFRCNLPFLFLFLRLFIRFLSQKLRLRVGYLLFLHYFPSLRHYPLFRKTKTVDGHKRARYGIRTRVNG